MTVYVGPTNWWWISSPTASINCKVKATLNTCGVGGALPDGSRVMCASSGLAILVAPSNTHVTQSWNGSSGVLVGNKPCVSDWTTLNTCLISRGFNPSDWFVPSSTQLQLAYTCRFRWDSAAVLYWSSTESNATSGFGLRFYNNFGSGVSKTSACWTIAFRCVTY